MPVLTQPPLGLHHAEVRVVFMLITHAGRSG